MICKKCGNPLNEGEMVCSKCGEKVEQVVTQPQPQVQNPQPNTVGIVNEGVQANGVAQPSIISNNTAPTQEQSIPSGIVNNSAPNPSMGVNNQQGTVPTMNNNVEPTPINPQPINSQPVNPQPVNPQSMNQQQMNQQQMNQQPLNPQQLNQQPISPQQVQEPVVEKKKGGKGLFIIILILLIAIIGGLAFYILKIKPNESNNQKSEETKETTESEVTEPTETTEAEPVANSNTETIGGLIVTIPDGLQHSIKNVDGEEMLYIIEQGKTMAALFKIYNEDASSYVTPEAITKLATEAGFTNGSASVTKYDEQTYAVYRFMQNESGQEVPGNLFIGKIDDKMAIGLLAEGNNYNAETAFGYITTITKSATGTSTGTFSKKIPNFSSGNSFAADLK